MGRTPSKKTTLNERRLFFFLRLVLTYNVVIVRQTKQETTRESQLAPILVVDQGVQYTTRQIHR